MTGMRCVLFDTFDQDTAVRIAAHRPTMLGSAVPFFLAYFHAQRVHGDEPLFPALRMLVGGGAPVPSEVSRSAREVLGVNGIGNAWGLTEFPVATFPESYAPPEVLDHTAGRPVPGVRLRVVDADEREVGPGREGELRLKGPQCFLGYLDPALDLDAFDGDRWFRTGDLGFVDDDGYVHVTGRLKDIIIRNAENISALEVEEAVMRHPAVLDATVLGVPDETVGERVAAIVVLADGRRLSIDELAQHCQDLGLAKHKTPEHLEVRDVLPRNPMGKVLKQQLLAEIS
jgi:acyl-CoA synthetase (AMP-forming)/AMP-acid ligase II